MELSLEAYVYPIMGEIQVSAIDTELVLKALEPIWTEIPETAGRVRGRIENILDNAKVKGHRSGENPARWAGHLKHTLPAKSAIANEGHFSSLPYQQIPEFWTKIGAIQGLGARATQLSILTAVRPSEANQAVWSEFNLDEKIWIIPPARMKEHKEHKVPLTDAVISILRVLHNSRVNEFVFPGIKGFGPISNVTALKSIKTVRASAAFDECTQHGFRASFKTWASERTASTEDIVETCLAHVPANGVIEAYQRGDLFMKRRALMECWTMYCLGKGDEISEDLVRMFLDPTRH